ncbi:hypothetical protein [Streptomyces sp. G-G2]|uniref:hypothetical protein n=1 Tax=Streptomyces sp. G-G2 TaxID=3046201 RepID=UPI0024B9429D|nr:hypothetical protein [Streptomyces sp. G-G2]MDJ0380358.1 hypothetical protein [Streptomyces sp. G-G2]
MRMRTALTATVLAGGVLLGGAGAAMASSGADFESYTAGATRYFSHCDSIAAIPAHFGPLYTSSCAKGGETEHEAYQHLG